MLKKLTKLTLLLVSLSTCAFTSLLPVDDGISVISNILREFSKGMMSHPKLLGEVVALTGNKTTTEIQALFDTIDALQKKPDPQSLYLQNTIQATTTLYLITRINRILTSCINQNAHTARIILSLLLLLSPCRVLILIQGSINALYFLIYFFPPPHLLPFLISTVQGAAFGLLAIPLELSINLQKIGNIITEGSTLLITMHTSLSEEPTSQEALFSYLTGVTITTSAVITTGLACWLYSLIKIFNQPTRTSYQPIAAPAA